MNLITSLQVDDLVFDNTNFILVSIKGLETPTTRLSRFPLPGTSGAFVSNALYGERAIQITGVVNAPDGLRSTYMANRTTLINNLAYKRDSNNNIVPQLMTITLEGGQVLTSEVYVDTPLQMAFTQDKTDYEDFQISFICPDPLLYSIIETSGSVNPPIGGGVAIPLAVPASLAPSSGGSLTIINSGSQVVYPIITLVAPLTNPYIANLTTGYFISLNKTISVGDEPVIIDCGAQTITQGLNDITGVQTVSSNFWSIAVGTNNIGFSAAAGAGNCSVAFYPAFLGV